MLVLTAIASALFAATSTTEIETPATPDLLALAAANYHFDPPADVTGSASSPVTFSSLTSDDSGRSIRKPFGTIDSKYWFVSAAGGSNFDEEHFGRIGAGISYFVADGFSFDFELNGMYFSQSEHDAVGLNFNFLMRWHFWQNEARTISFYADAGAGIMIGSEDVPDEGSRFNFTPQVGVGMSFDIGEGGNNLRLFTGVRWHHVSNARLFENNPGTDLAMFYVMLSWPF